MNPYDSTDDLLVAVRDTSKMFEAAKVTTVKGYRTRKDDGATVEVTVEIHDRGESEPYRWAVAASDESGRGASGNPHAKLEAALATVHWHDLDQP